MQTRDLKVTDGAAAGAWIRPRLGSEISRVADQVPDGYEAYVRIFHPAGHPAVSPSGGLKSPRPWAELHIVRCNGNRWSRAARNGKGKIR